MPSHSHDKILSGGNADWPLCDNTGIGGAPYTYAHTVQVTGTTKDNFADAAWTTNSKGGSQPHNNMPPYLVVYMWKRLS
jgi:microcystin-dependent protein